MISMQRQKYGKQKKSKSRFYQIHSQKDHWDKLSKQNISTKEPNGALQDAWLSKVDISCWKLFLSPNSLNPYHFKVHKKSDCSRHSWTEHIVWVSLKPHQSPYWWYDVLEFLCPENLDAYKNDVQIQSEAKLMADKFNAYNPPKKIDFLRMSVIELSDGSGAYHMEAFIDGEYVKHNSNAGYVADESQAGVSRRTPQCFSHFTYVFSTGKNH